MASEANSVASQLSPHPHLRQYYLDEVGRRSYLDQAFDVSAKYYDRLSWLLGFGTDCWYRRQALLRAGLASGMSIKEFKRVLKPGGRLLIVEMTLPPPGLVYQLIRFYMKTLIPLITRLWSRSRITQELYVYCWETHDQCVSAEVILSTLQQVGLQDVQRWVEVGVFSEYTGRK